MEESCGARIAPRRLTEATGDTRPANSLPSAIRLGDGLAHPASGVHEGRAESWKSSPPDSRSRKRILLFCLASGTDIAAMEGAHIVTGREVLFRISSFWIKIFSVAFGMGVVSGIVMPFQFGTNWSFRCSRRSRMPHGQSVG